MTHPRTGLCDLHHAEYQRAHGAWRGRTAYHRKNPGSPDPGRWEDAEAQIEYTPIDQILTALTPEDRALMRMLADKVEGVASVLPPFVTGDAYLETSVDDFRVLAGYLQSNIADVVRVLRVYGQEPTQPEARTSE